MTETWLTIVALAAVTYALKSFGPLVLGGDRKLPVRVTRLARDLPAPLLAALVAISALTSDSTLTIDARVVGIAAAGLALWRKLPFVAVVVIAALATAVARAV